jgi:NADH-quinone oxidoreductase subunit G
MVEARLKAYVLFGGIDPAVDLAGDADEFASAELLIAMTTHLPESLKSRVHIVLPIGSFAETAGTFVNVEGCWQSWKGAAKPPGESRPGWKVLRVLANLLNLPDCEYASADEVLAELKTLCAGLGATDVRASLAPAPGGEAPVGEWIDLPPYQGDVLVRGSGALAKTRDGQIARTVL